jgi:hypothetical protein
MQLGEPIPELGGRTWNELEVIDHPEDGCLLFKDQLRKRMKSGSVELVDVRVRILRPKHLAMARVNCRNLCERLKLDIEKDNDLFEELESVCQLALAIRTSDAPFGQLADPDELIEKYDEACLKDILGRIKALGNVLDVRDSDLTEEQVWKKIAAVSEAGSLLPLTDIGSHEQTACIIFMARQAVRSPRAPAWLISFVNSTQEQSMSKSSAESSAVSTG